MSKTLTKMTNEELDLLQREVDDHAERYAEQRDIIAQMQRLNDELRASLRGDNSFWQEIGTVLDRAGNTLDSLIESNNRTMREARARQSLFDRIGAPYGESADTRPLAAKTQPLGAHKLYG